MKPNWSNRTLWTGDNLQLLCGACNSMKGAHSQEQFIARLKDAGLR